MDEEYLKLFSQISKEDTDDEDISDSRTDYSQFENLSKPNPQNNMLKETPNTSYFQQYNMNETPDVSQYKIEENLNDGWDMNFQFETRINGEVVKDSPAPAAPPRFNRRQAADPNGLNKYLEEENLNEVYRPEKEKSINEVISEQNELVGPVNEDLSDVAVVSVALFEKINNKAFLGLAGTVNITKLQGGALEGDNTTTLKGVNW